jgi:hypothetical protein
MLTILDDRAVQPHVIRKRFIHGRQLRIVQQIAALNRRALRTAQPGCGNENQKNFDEDDVLFAQQNAISHGAILPNSIQKLDVRIGAEPRVTKCHVSFV